ncbi:DoxX family protein [Candidatus Rhodoluna planktonica]|uniref:DoxX family protein n=1 Tax=Candidatus Rhodoluna planktonica TaxID=535712 RepID=A0A1D9DYF6_9MICO|nr:DoxX family protein [Candidatus Rhodoluna planktonica]AOY55832.1 hypothetical protein A4Z71_02250 [Candidatus Rhodoluna planktonica]
MNYVWAIAALAVSVFVANGFFKAGKFKATSSRETLLGAGFGWIEKIPFGVVRLIAWLEIIGAAGIVVAPLAAWILPGFEWAQIWGILAAAGLALTMVGAIIVHAARKESKYTFKMNASLLLAAVVAGVLQALVVLPLF